LALHKITTFGLSLAALVASGWLATASAQAPDASPAATPPSSDSTTPASGDTSTPDATKPAPKAMHHHTHAMHWHSMSASKGAGDAAVEDLNAQSLDAAKAGKSFTPPSTTPTEEKSMAKPEGKSMAKPMHHHHHMAAKKPADTSAPSDSSTPPAPSDNATPPDSTPK
jgi:hypothetical protein